MYKRVLVPVDGSGVAESILPFIREIAGPSDLDVILLQVNGFIPPMAIEGTRYFAADDFEARREEAETYLDLLGAELRNSRVRVHTRVRRGEPVDEILAAAQDEHVDLEVARRRRDAAAARTTRPLAGLRSSHGAARH